MEALLLLGLLSLASGLLLVFAAWRFRVEGNPVADSIENLLPQTQCGQCGYPGCKPYAEAIANGETGINRCAPGGDETIAELAELLGVEIAPLEVEERPPSVAFVHEAECIGCTKCIQACPVDAIIGAAKQMHTVIESECTGCDLCVEPCPTDCIEMLPLGTGTDNWVWPLPEKDTEAA